MLFDQSLMFIVHQKELANKHPGSLEEQPNIPFNFLYHNYISCLLLKHKFFCVIITDLRPNLFKGAIFVHVAHEWKISAKLVIL